MEEQEEEKRIVKAVLIDVENDSARKVEFEHSLGNIYGLLHCDCIDIVSRAIGHGRSSKRFDIICDDEGTFKMNARISAIDNLGRPMLVGSLLVTNHDAEGNTVSLTDDECEFVLAHVEKLGTRKHPDGYMMLTQCEG
jgi:hypothetical protein